MELVLDLVLFSLSDYVAVCPLSFAAHVRQLFQLMLLSLVHYSQLSVNHLDVLQLFKTFIFLQRILADFLAVPHRDLLDFFIHYVPLLSNVD
jgi:hypothetical protein